MGRADVPNREVAEVVHRERCAVHVLVVRQKENQREARREVVRVDELDHTLLLVVGTLENHNQVPIDHTHLLLSPSPPIQKLLNREEPVVAGSLSPYETYVAAAMAVTLNGTSLSG